MANIAVVVECIRVDTLLVSGQKKASNNNRTGVDNGDKYNERLRERRFYPHYGFSPFEAPFCCS